MNHIDKINAIQFIKPNAQFVLRGDEVEWLDENQTEPTPAQIKAALISYNAAQAAEAQEKATAKAALLDRLGITADEAKLLLS